MTKDSKDKDGPLTMSPIRSETVMYWFCKELNSNVKCKKKSFKKASKSSKPMKHFTNYKRKDYFFHADDKHTSL